MSKRISIEAKIMDYFRTEPMEKVRLLFGLVREEVRQRELGLVVVVASPLKKRRGRKPKLMIPVEPQNP